MRHSDIYICLLKKIKIASGDILVKLLIHNLITWLYTVTRLWNCRFFFHNLEQEIQICLPLCLFLSLSFCSLPQRAADTLRADADRQVNIIPSLNYHICLYYWIIIPWGWLVNTKSKGYGKKIFFGLLFSALSSIILCKRSLEGKKCLHELWVDCWV